MNIDSGTTGRHRHPVAFLTHPRSEVLRGLGQKAALYAGLTRHVRLPGRVPEILRHADRPDTVAAWLITVPLAPQELWPQERCGSRRALDMIERAVAQAPPIGRADGGP